MTFPLGLDQCVDRLTRYHRQHLIVAMVDHDVENRGFARLHDQWIYLRDVVQIGRAWSVVPNGVFRHLLNVAQMDQDVG